MYKINLENLKIHGETWIIYMELCDGWMHIKGAQSCLFNFFFPKFWRFCYHEKAHIFLITHDKVYSWKVFRLEDINENVSSYGIHNWAYTVRFATAIYKIAFVHQNGLTVSSEIWNLHLWSDDSSNFEI